MKRLLLAALLLAPLSAEAYPDRPVTIIHPYGTGTAADATARTLAEIFAAELGQNFVVANRDGGSGVVGMRVLAASAPDGHTLAYTPMTPLAVQPHLVRNTGLGPDVVAPICNVAENVLGVVVKADSPIRDMQGLVQAARARPLNFGSPGPNSIPQIGIERVRAAAAGEYIHVPFRGDAASITETLAGRLDFSAVVVASAGPQIRSGNLRLIGVFSDRRNPEFPDVPTVKEQGIDAVQTSFAALYAPRGTPEAILNRLEAACEKAMQNERFRRVASNYGVVVHYQPRAQLRRLLDSEYREFQAILRQLGVEPE